MGFGQGSARIGAAALLLAALAAIPLPARGGAVTDAPAPRADPPPADGPRSNAGLWDEYGFPRQGMIRPPLRKGPAGPFGTADAPADGGGDSFGSQGRLGSPSTGRSVADPRGTLPIRVDDLGERDLETIGLLIEDAMGEEVWKDSQRAVIENLLAPPFSAPPSGAMRRLLARLLTGPALPPAGDPRRPWIALRIAALQALGRYDRALALYDIVFPTAAEVPASVRRDRAEMLLAAYRLAEACDIDSQDDLFGRKLAIFCSILHEQYDAEKLDFDIEVLGEIAVDDPGFSTFARLARHLLVRQEAPEAVEGTLDPLLLAMARSGSVPIAPNADAGDRPLLWQAMAVHPGVDPVRRLEMAERALRLGIIEADVLHRILEVLPPERFAGADGTTEAGGSARWLYRMDLLRRILQQEEDRVERIHDFLELSRDGGVPAAARLVEPWLRPLSPTPENAVFAAPLIRAHLALGAWEQALAWYRAAQDSDLASAQKAALDVWPLMRLAFEGAEAESDAQRDIFWLRRAARSDPEQARGRGEVFLGLLQALGRGDADPGRVALLGIDGDGTRGDELYRMPEVLDWGAIDGAALGSRVGETILIAARMLPPPRRAIHPLTMIHVVGALQRLGLNDPARELALETAFDHGL